MPPPNWRRAPDCNGTQRALHVPLALQHIQALASFFLLRLADHIVVQVPEYVVGYCESINGRLKDELLNGEIFYTLKEAQIIIEEWRIHYKQKDRTVRWATAHLPRKPSFRWIPGWSCTNIQTGPLNECRPSGLLIVQLCLFLAATIPRHSVSQIN